MQIRILNGAVQVSSRRIVISPLRTKKSWIAQKAAKASSWPRPMPSRGSGAAAQVRAEQDAEQGQQRRAADPGLDAVPAAGDQRARRAPAGARRSCRTRRARAPHRARRGGRRHGRSAAAGPARSTLPSSTVSAAWPAPTCPARPARRRASSPARRRSCRSTARRNDTRPRSAAPARSARDRDSRASRAIVRHAASPAVAAESSGVRPAPVHRRAKLSGIVGSRGTWSRQLASGRSSRWRRCSG